MLENPDILSSFIRPSTIWRWNECSLRETQKAAAHQIGRIEREPTHVAALVGTLAHAKIAEAEEPEDPAWVKYDVVTPDRSQADSQAERIAKSAREWLEVKEAVDAPHGVLKEHRVEGALFEGMPDDWGGTIDRVLRDNSAGDVLIDLKTGARRQWTALLQLAVYSLLYEKAEGREVSELCVLHLPRTPRGTEQPDVVAIEVNDAEALGSMKELALRSLRSALAAYHDPAESALASPGDHCITCPHPCALVTGVLS